MDETQKRNMNTFERGGFPPVGLGMSTVILGAIGFGLFLIPIVGISICVSAMVVGALGIAVARRRGGRISVRLCVAGLLLSICGLAFGAAIARAPAGYFSPRAVFPAIQPQADRPYVAPPAAPRLFLGVARLVRRASLRQLFFM